MNLNLTLPDYAYETIIKFIRDFTLGKGVVVGLSGGLDSSVVLALCVHAIGPEKVIAVHMPDSITPSIESEHAKIIAEKYGVDMRIINIEPAVRELKKISGVSSLNAVANLKARTRMTILYSIANENSLLVAGTSNKSELLTGYFTKYGDGASDFAPIGDLYKTQVRLLAREIGIPEEIIRKKPSANLLPDQYDEDELGVKYEILDRILYGIELNIDIRKIQNILGVNERVIRRVYALYESSKHKRVLLYIPKLGIRTVNTDWRE